MSAKIEIFLALYKEYEQLLRNAGQDPKEEENAVYAVSAAQGDRLRMCRQFRNYFAHSNDPLFLEPTGQMMAFMESTVYALRMQTEVANKHLTRPATSVVADTTKCCDAALMLLPLGQERVVVTTKDGYAVYRMFDIIEAALKQPKATKIKSLKPLRVKPVFVRPDTPMQEIDPLEVNICTNDGTPEGFLMGIVIV